MAALRRSLRVTSSLGPAGPSVEFIHNRGDERWQPLHDFGAKAIVVMDAVQLRSGGKYIFRRLAVARNKGRGKGWLMKADGFCWADPRARDNSKNPLAARFPNLMIVPTKREALAILRDLADE